MSADVFAEGEPNRTEPHWFVVKAEPCPFDGKDIRPLTMCVTVECNGCLGDGSRLDVSSAIPVEPFQCPACDDDLFAPVSSTEAET